MLNAGLLQLRNHVGIPATAGDHCLQDALLDPSLVVGLTLGVAQKVQGQEAAGEVQVLIGIEKRNN